MKNKILKNLDRLNRLLIPVELLDLANIECNSDAALCMAKKGIKIVPLQNLKNCKVIGVIKIGNKGRFVIPNYLLDNDVERTFSIYYLNGSIYIEPIGDEEKR